MRPEELRNRKEGRRIFGQVIGAFIHDRELAACPKTSSGGEFAGSPLRPVIGNDKIRGRVVGLLGIVPVVEPQVELVSGGQSAFAALVSPAPSNPEMLRSRMIEP